MLERIAAVPTGPHHSGQQDKGQWCQGHTLYANDIIRNVSRHILSLTLLRIYVRVCFILEPQATGLQLQC